jgi:hypothetical protein
MNKLDAMIAPRALTSEELAQVVAPQLIVYGIAHRAFIHASVLQDGVPGMDAAVVGASESALQGVIDDALTSMGDWLADMESDGTPRFYRKGAVKDAVTALCHSAAGCFVRQSNEVDVATLAEAISDRDHKVLQMLIEGCGHTA